MTLREEIRAAMEWTAPYMVEHIAEFIEAREAILIERVLCGCWGDDGDPNFCHSAACNEVRP